MMKENGPDIVQVTAQCEKTSSCLIRPDLDLIVVTSRHEQGLSLVKINTSNRSVVLLESVNQCAHAVVPQLDGGGMKRNQNPWSRYCVNKVAPIEGGSRMLTAWDERRDPWLSRILIRTAILLIVSHEQWNASTYLGKHSRGGLHFGKLVEAAASLGRELVRRYFQRCIQRCLSDSDRESSVSLKV